MACQYEGSSSPRSQPPARNSRANAPTAGSVSLLAESAERFSNEKITLIEVYENASIIVLVGHRVRRGTRVLLKVDRLRRDEAVLPPVHEDGVEYSPSACAEALASLGHSGGALSKLLEADAVLGMIRFLEGYYLLFVTRSEPVGIICGHSVFRVEETSMLSVVGGGAAAYPVAAEKSADAGAERRAERAAERTAERPMERQAERPAERAARSPHASGSVSSNAAAAHASCAFPADSSRSGVEACGAAASGYEGARASSSSAGAGAAAASAARGRPSPLMNLGKMLQTSAAGVISRLQLAGKWDERWAEKRYKSLFMSMELTRDFYYSHTYDMTNTLQSNMGRKSKPRASSLGASAADCSARTEHSGSFHGASSPSTSRRGSLGTASLPRRASMLGGQAGSAADTIADSISAVGCADEDANAAEARSPARGNAAAASPPPAASVTSSSSSPPPLRDMFVWNHHLVVGLFQKVSDVSWLTPLVHGFFRQSTLSLCGRQLSITLVARRSRMFAGARLLKRGLCASGHTANEVETEQIVADGSRGALHTGCICGAVQLRGSIPLVWGHGEQKQIVPRPDIHLQNIDPSYEYTLRHFELLWRRYGAPVIVFDLVRQTEKKARESLLGAALANALNALQSRLDREGHPHRESGLRYVPFDFKKESKRKGVDLLQTIERIADMMVRMTGFYCSGSVPSALAVTHVAGRALNVASRVPQQMVSAAEAEAARRLDDRTHLTALSAAHGRHKACASTASLSARGCRSLEGSAHGGGAFSLSFRGDARGSRSGGARRPLTPRSEPSPRFGKRNWLALAARHGDGAVMEASEALGGSYGSNYGGGYGGGYGGMYEMEVEEGEEEEDDDDDEDDDESDSMFGVLHPYTEDGTRSRAAGGGSFEKDLSGLLPNGADATADGARADRFAQRGIIRTNCIDCLDRTNVAQFCIGRCLLKRQLAALGVTSAAVAPAEADGLKVANALLMSMYEEMGTQLALQYAGSQALHATNSNAAKDFLQSVKRFYRNTFTDMEKQQIMDVFLGVYTPAAGEPNIWDLDSDLYLHNNPPPTLGMPLPPMAQAIVTTRASAEDNSERGVDRRCSDAGLADGRTHAASRAALRHHAAFDMYYEPGKYTSFDELLARPFAQPLHSHGKGRRGQQSPRQSGGGQAPTNFALSHANSKEQLGSDGLFSWASAPWEEYVGVSLGEQSTMPEDVSHERVGQQHVMLPATYTQLDTWQRNQVIEREQTEDVYKELLSFNSDVEMTNIAAVNMYKNYVHSATSSEAFHVPEVRSRHVAEHRDHRDHRDYRDQREHRDNREHRSVSI